MTSALRAFSRRMTGQDLRATGRAVLLAVAVELALRMVSLDRVAHRLGLGFADGSRVDPRTEPAVPPGAVARVALDPRERVACRAVARVMRRWPGDRGTCLREALLYGHALRTRNPRLHVGAGTIDDRVVGHAWLSFDGGTLGYRRELVELTSDGR